MLHPRQTHRGKHHAHVSHDTGGFNGQRLEGVPDVDDIHRQVRVVLLHYSGHQVDLYIHLPTRQNLAGRRLDAKLLLGVLAILRKGKPPKWAQLNRDVHHK